MDTHPFDPIALIAGLFFGLAGLALLADQQWDDLDVTAFTAAGVMVIGLVLAGMIVARFVLSDPTDPVPDDHDGATGSYGGTGTDSAMDESAPGHEA
jgi:hypothetical protein